MSFDHKFIIYYCTNLAPLYRKSLWKLLLENSHNDMHFIFGENHALGINPIDFNQKEFALHKSKLHRIKNIWLNHKILIWQKGVISKFFKSKFDMAIFLGEMYCISTWLAVIICRMRAIKVVYWGHGLYGNEGKLKLFLRKAFFRLAHNHLLYERRAKQLMVNEGFNPEKLYVVFNSLDYMEHKKLRIKYEHINKSDVFSFFSKPTLPVLVFIGRLTTVKKLNMLYQAVAQINKKQIRANLLIIGDGPEKQNLKITGEQGLKSCWLYFTGAIYNEEEIGKYLSASDLCVSPGNVGLTAIHSLSFGTPVCTHGNLSNQMPEAEAITEGYNGFFFKENDINNLKRKIINWLETNVDREKIREQCYEIIDTYYNPYYQLSVFNQMLNNEKPEL